MLSSAASIVLCCTISVVDEPRTDLVWLENIEQAVQKAKVEHKSVLASFLGPDWDATSRAVREEVLHTPAFAEYASKRFVCVEIRFPGFRPISPERCKYNTELKNRFQVGSYPSLVLLDANGLPYAQVVGGEELLDANEWIGQLKLTFRVKEKFDALMQDARHSSGMARATLLAHGVELIPENLQLCYEPVMQEIVKMDPDDMLGFAKKLDKLVRHRDQSERLDTLRDLVSEQKFDEADVMVDEMLASPDLLPEMRQKLLARYQMHRYAVRKKDMRKAYEILKAAYDAAPSSEMAPKLKEQLARMKLYVE